jgi:hypothetical protein
MHHGTCAAFNRRAAAATIAVTLALSAAAFAALPEADGQYAGSTSAAKIGGFAAPVAFVASANRRHLLGFTYGTFACFRTYARGTSPYSTGTLAVARTIPVSAGGHFAIAHSRDSVIYNTAGHPTITTTTKLSGKFTSATRASGTISFTRTYKPSHAKALLCGSGKVTFHAKFTHAP